MLVVGPDGQPPQIKYPVFKSLREAPRNGGTMLMRDAMRCNRVSKSEWRNHPYDSTTTK